MLPHTSWNLAPSSWSGTSRMQARPLFGERAPRERARVE